MTFTRPEDSHNHSLGTLNQLSQYDDFMGSIRTVLDLGCGNGKDLEWWATQTTRDDNPQPLNIRCTGVDLAPELSLTKYHNNIFYHPGNFEKNVPSTPLGFDILWCHDAFQFAQTPIATLSQWWNLASTGAMLYLAIPTTQRIHRNQLDYHLPSGCFYHYTIVSLIYMLATSGWDCRSGFFKQNSMDPWIHAIVYKSAHAPLDPMNASWHALVELDLLPDSAVKSVMAHNYLKQQDLVIPWIDHSLISMSLK